MLMFFDSPPHANGQRAFVDQVDRLSTIFNGYVDDSLIVARSYYVY